MLFSAVFPCLQLNISFFRSIFSANMWNFHISKIFIHLDVYLYPIHWPAPSWLISSIGRALHRYRRGHGFKSRTGLNFFLVLFTTARFSSVLSCEDLLISSLYRSANMWNFHISKIFIHLDVYLYPIHWTAPSWLVSSIGRALHRFSMDKLVRLAKPVHVAVLKLIELTCLMK